MTVILQNRDGATVASDAKPLIEELLQGPVTLPTVHNSGYPKTTTKHESQDYERNFLLEGCKVDTRRGRKVKGQSQIPFLQSRLSQNAPPVILELYAHGASRLIEVDWDWNILITAHLLPGESEQAFRGKLTRRVREQSGEPLLWFGVYCSMPIPHVHLISGAPKRSRQRDAVMDFLCERADCSRFELWKRRSGLAVNLGAINWRGRYKGLRGLTTYLKRHFDDVGRVDGHEAIPVACQAVTEAAGELLDDIRLARSLDLAPAGIAPENVMPAAGPVSNVLPVRDPADSDPVLRQFQQDKAMLIRVCWTIMQEQGRTAEQVREKLMPAWKQLRFGAEQQPTQFWT